MNSANSKYPGVAAMLVSVLAVSFFWPVQEIFKTWEWLWLYAAVFHLGQASLMLIWVSCAHREVITREGRQRFWAEAARKPANLKETAQHPFLISVAGRSGTMMMASGLLWSDSPIAAVFGFCGGLLFVPLRRITARDTPQGEMAFGRQSWFLFLGAVLSVWLVAASQTGRIFEGWHWGMILMCGGGALDAINVERNLEFASKTARQGEDHIGWAVLCCSVASLFAAAGFFAGGLVFQTGITVDALFSTDVLAVYACSAAVGGIATIAVRKGMLATDRLEIFVLLQLAPAVSVLCLLAFREAGLLEIQIARWDYYTLGVATLTSIAMLVSLGRRLPAASHAIAP